MRQVPSGKICGSKTINHSVETLPGTNAKADSKLALNPEQLSQVLNNDLLLRVNRPGQYLGNEWRASRKKFEEAYVHLCLVFPDLYELGMSNFGQRIL